MLVGHQLSLDCGLNGDFNCQLQEQSLSSINIQAQQIPAQYNYYLLINNQLQESCQLSLKAQIEQEIEQIPWSSTLVKIFYQDQELFDGTLNEFFGKKISLLNLTPYGFRLYRLEFHLTELSDEFQLNFSLNFLIYCQQLTGDRSLASEILGAQTEQREPQLFEPMIKNENVFLKQRLFLIVALFVFLLFLLLIFLIYRSKITKLKKLLISSKKGKIYEQKYKN